MCGWWLDAKGIEVVAISSRNSEGQAIGFDDAPAALEVIVLNAVASDRALAAREETLPVVLREVIIPNTAPGLGGIAHGRVDEERFLFAEPAEIQLSLRGTALKRELGEDVGKSARAGNGPGELLVLNAATAFCNPCRTARRGRAYQQAYTEQADAPDCLYPSLRSRPHRMILHAFGGMMDISS